MADPGVAQMALDQTLIDFMLICEKSTKEKFQPLPPEDNRLPTGNPGSPTKNKSLFV